MGPGPGPTRWIRRDPMGPYGPIWAQYGSILAQMGSCLRSIVNTMQIRPLEGPVHHPPNATTAKGYALGHLAKAETPLRCTAHISLVALCARQRHWLSPAPPPPPPALAQASPLPRVLVARQPPSTPRSAPVATETTVLSQWRLHRCELEVFQRKGQGRRCGQEDRPVQAPVDKYWAQRARSIGPNPTRQA